MNHNVSRDRWSGVVGLLAFLVGLGMIGLSFKLAYDLFMIPPHVAMKIEPGQPLEVSRAANSLIEVLVRLLVLIVMAWLGSMVANRGIKLYASRGVPSVPPKSPPSDDEQST